MKALVLVLRHELQKWLAAKRSTIEWADIVRDLDPLHETTIRINDHAYAVRSETKRTIGKVFQACGVAIPPRAPPGVMGRAEVVQEDGSA